MNSEKIILGIDPGTTIMGFGLIKVVNKKIMDLMTAVVFYPEERKITLELLGYPENSVGRLMTTGYVYVYEYNTVAEVLNTIRRFGTNTETLMDKISPEVLIYLQSVKNYFETNIEAKEFFLSNSF